MPPTKKCTSKASSESWPRMCTFCQARTSQVTLTCCFMWIGWPLVWLGSDNQPTLEPNRLKSPILAKIGP